MSDLSTGINRRDILKTGLVGMFGLLPLVSLAAPAQAGVFSRLIDRAKESAGVAPQKTYLISFRNLHTGESFDGAYRIGNTYLPDSFERINNVLRDFRTGQVFPIDPRVMDVIWTVRERTGSKAPYQVISGYRSPQTNAMLHSTTPGVAVNSLHMVGKAIDVHLPDVQLASLRDTAMGVQGGGVGYYPNSNFVHMDTGRIRHWAMDPHNT